MKKLILALLNGAGILGLLMHLIKPRSVVIFMIHGVEDPDEKDWVPAWRRHTRSHLRLVITVLSKYFDIVSLDEAVASLKNEGESKRRKKLVFTYDDGYRNNLLAAYPVMKEQNVPGTFYLATGFIEQRQAFWIDRLDYLFQHMGQDKIPVKMGPVETEIDLTSREAYEKTYRNLRIRIKNEIPDDIEMLKQIDLFATKAEKECGKALIGDVLEQDKWSAVLSKEELKAMPSAIDLGGHTVNHRRVDTLDVEKLTQELEESRAYVEAHSDQKCNNFCYPNGDYSQEAARVVEKLGFSSAVTSDRGSNKAGDDLFTLKRVPLPYVESKAELLYYMIRNI